MTILDFIQKKVDKQKISMVTCYDHWSAQILNDTPIDALLVGDSLAMIMYGHPSTLSASPPLMAQHIKAVCRGAPNKLIVGDLPFLSYRKNLTSNMRAVEILMQAGCHAVKLEGAKGNIEFIRHLVDSGVPVMGHLGLTPQSIHQLGGFKVQGKKQVEYDRIFEESLQLVSAGCFSIVLECVPSALGKAITEAITVPTIGIGAGPDTDGQILVLQDMLGMNQTFRPKFLRTYLQGSDMLKEAISKYHHDVLAGEFPNTSESYQ